MSTVVLIVVGVVGESAFADPASPITVTKTASSSSVASGGLLTYTIVVKNNGGASLKNVVLTDQVNGLGVVQTPPALPQLTIISTKGSCTQGGANGNLVTCNAGTMAGNESFTVTIGGQVTAGSGTVLNNTASVTGTKSAQNFTTQSNALATSVSGGSGSPKPDLSINKTGPTSVAPSSAIIYTLTVNNIGTANATGVKVVDTVPAGVTAISASGSSLFACGVVSQTVTCTGGAVNQGQNATITINGTSPAVTGQITNTSVVDPDNTINEGAPSSPAELNNTSATVYTTVGGPPAEPLLSIKKTDGSPLIAEAWATGAGEDPTFPGELLTYKIHVKNNAKGTNARADDVVITDSTQGLVASSITASQTIVNGTVGTTGGCVVTAPQVRCSIRSLNANGTMTVTIQGTVIQSAGSSIFNTATVTGNIKNQGVSNTSSEVTTVRPRVELTITKDDGPDPVCASSWPTGDPNVGQHLPLTASRGEFQNFPASGSPTLLLDDPVCLGGLTYDFVVGNSGLANAEGVLVRDPLPAGVIFDTYENVDPPDPDGGAGFVCDVNVELGISVVECSGGTIPAESTRTLRFRLVAPPNVGSITNTAYVDPNNAIWEPDETNNDSTESTTISTGIDLTVWKGDSVDANPPGDDDEGAPTLVPGTSVDLADGYDPIATRGTQTYTIYVDNVGTQNSTGIRVRDTLPADTVFLSVVADSDHGFTCSHNGAATGGIIECVDGHILGTENEFYDDAGLGPFFPLPTGDDFATIKIRVFARKDVGTMHNEVRVDPSNAIAEVNELNNIDTEQTRVVSGDSDQGAFHQLKVTKTQASPIPDPGPSGEVATNGTLTYNLLVENWGTDPISNVIVVDTLPTGTRFIQAKDTATGSAAFNCSHNGAALGGVITCTGGDLNGSILTMAGEPNGPDVYPLMTPPDAARNITIKVFAPDTPANYTNQADVDPANLVPEGNEFDNNTQVDTFVRPCVDLPDCTNTNAFKELTVTKKHFSPLSGTVATNGTLTYDLEVENWGSDPIYNIVVGDTLPSGTRFIEAKDTDTVPASEAFLCTHNGAVFGGTVTCSGGDLDGTTLPGVIPAGTTRTIKIKVFAPNTPGTYTNLAAVDPGNTVPEGNEFNNDTHVDTTVRPCTNLGDCTDTNAFYELTIEKTQNRGNPDPAVAPEGPNIARNGLNTYTLLIRNWGSDPVSDIVVEDALPVGARLLDAKDGATPSDPMAFTCGAPKASNVITCTGGDLSGAGGPTPFRTIVVRAFMPDLPATYPNQATVDPYNAIPEGNEFNNESSLVTVVANGGLHPWIDLQVEKTQLIPDPTDPNTEDDHGGSHTGIVQPGALLRYKLHVTNVGEGDAFNVVVRDIVPALATFFNAADLSESFACAFSAPNLNCTGGTLLANDGAPGGPDEKDIIVQLHAPVSIEAFASDKTDIEIQMINQAVADPANETPEGDEANNTDIFATNVRSKLNLTLDKSGPQNATQNQTTEYTIKVTNNTIWGGGALAQNVKVIDGLPIGLIPIGSVEAGGNFVCQLLENPVNFVSCEGDLAAGDEVTITIPVFITADGGILDNEACVDPDHVVAETNELDNCDHELTQVGPAVEPADLSIDKTASTGSVTAGQEFTYNVAVSNIGGTDATGTMTMTDNLPAAVELMGVNPASGWICPLPVTPNQLVCTRTGLAAGSTENIEISVKVKTGVDAPTSAFTNRAEVSGNTEVEFDEVIVGVGGGAIDLTVTSITDTPDPVPLSTVIPPAPSNLTYTIIAQNNGTSPAPNAVVRVELPDMGITPVSVTGNNGFTCVVVTGDPETFDCTGDFAASGPPEASTTITAIVLVGLTAPPVLKIKVTVDPSSTFVESDETNNTMSATTSVTGTPICSSSPCVDLIVADVSDSPDPVTTPGSFSYDVSIFNLGDAAVDATAIWAIHFQYFGTGSPTLNWPAGVTCAAIGPLGEHHAHCTSTAGADGMDLGPGQGLTFTVDVTGATPGAAASLTVTADPLEPLGAIAEGNESNNSVTESTTSAAVCTACVDLNVNVYDSPDPATTPGSFSYVVSIFNGGDTAVDSTAIWDIHFQYFGSGSPTLYWPAGVACAAIGPMGDHHVHCTSTAGADGMDLGPGEVLTFTVEVTGETDASASLNVEADPAEPLAAMIAEFNELNNSVTESTTIVP